VDRPAKGAALRNYPVVWAAGDADLTGPMQKHIEEYLRRGGTLVINITTAAKLPPALTGVLPVGKKPLVAEQWIPDGGEARFTTPFEVMEVAFKKGDRVLAWAKIGNDKTWSEVPLILRHEVGAGAVIVTLVPHMLGHDERAHPALPFLLNGLTADLMPLEVRLANGERPRGEIMYQVNKTKDGYLVALVNCQGIDKTQTGLARVDRRAFVDVVLRTPWAVKSAREYTQPRDLTAEAADKGSVIRVRVHPGDVQVVHLAAK
jgi:hypothetical protein